MKKKKKKAYQTKRGSVILRTPAPYFWKPCAKQYIPSGGWCRLILGLYHNSMISAWSEIMRKSEKTIEISAVGFWNGVEITSLWFFKKCFDTSTSLLVSSSFQEFISAIPYIRLVKRIAAEWVTADRNYNKEIEKKIETVLLLSHLAYTMRTKGLPAYPARPKPLWARA